MHQQRPGQQLAGARRLLFTWLTLLGRWLASGKQCPVYAGKDWDHLTSLPYRTDLLTKELLFHGDSSVYTLPENTLSTGCSAVHSMLLLLTSSRNTVEWMPIFHSNNLFNLSFGQRIDISLVNPVAEDFPLTVSMTVDKYMLFIFFPSRHTDWIFLFHLLSLFIIPLIPLCIVFCTLKKHSQSFGMEQHLWNWVKFCLLPLMGH